MTIDFQKEPSQEPGQELTREERASEARARISTIISSPVFEDVRWTFSKTPIAMAGGAALGYTGMSYAWEIKRPRIARIAAMTLGCLTGMQICVWLMQREYAKADPQGLHREELEQLFKVVRQNQGKEK